MYDDIDYDAIIRDVLEWLHLDSGYYMSLLSERKIHCVRVANFLRRCGFRCRIGENINGEFELFIYRFNNTKIV